MKIDIKNTPVSYPELQQKLESRFPNYTFKMRGKQMLIGSQSSTVGANILIRKNKIIVAGNFPTMGGTLLFALSLVLLGILIPLIVYFAAFHSNLKKFEKEIGGYLQEEYSTI